MNNIFYRFIFFIIGLLIGIILTFVFFKYSNPSLVKATAVTKVTLCHHTESKTNPWVPQEVNANEVQSHLANGDMLIDVDHPCPPVASPTPSPNPTASPTGTPEPTATPNPCGNLSLDVSELQQDQVCSTPSPTPHPSRTPRPTPADCDHDGDPKDPSDVAGKECPNPTETPVPSETPSPENNSQPGTDAGPAFCGDVSTTLLPGNPLLKRKGPDAIIQWQPTEGSWAMIFYKQVGSSIWQYSVNGGNPIPNNGYYDNIHDLGALDLTFAIEQTNGGCSGGVITPANTIIDSASVNGWTLFVPTK